MSKDFFDKAFSGKTKTEEIVKMIVDIFMLNMVKEKVNHEEKHNSFGRRRFVFFAGNAFNRYFKHVSLSIYYNGDVSVKFFTRPKSYIIDRTSFFDEGDNIWNWLQREALNAKKHLYPESASKESKTTLN